MLVNECDKDLIYLLQVAFSIKVNEFACRKKKFVNLAKKSFIPDNRISQGTWICLLKLVDECGKE